jgi:hypothetical protein
MFSSAGFGGDKGIIAVADAMFKKFQKGDTDAVHPNLQAAVFAMALIHGGESEYDTILARYRDAPTADERNTCLRVLILKRLEDDRSTRVGYAQWYCSKADFEQTFVSRFSEETITVE